MVDKKDMNKQIIDWMKETQHLLPFNLGKVLDVGSLNVNGSAREVYTRVELYIGMDTQKGEDVDLVMNGHDLINSKFGYLFDTIICANTLEHDNKFWLTLEGINCLLKKKGFLIFCVPTITFPIHNHPKDYWRMSEQAVREVIFEGYDILDIKEVFTKEIKGKPINPIICAIGRKL